MKSILFFLIAFLSIELIAQTSGDAISINDSDFWRIQNGIKNKDVKAFEDLIPSGITIQIGDSVYRHLSSIKAFDVLNEFLTSKDSINFIINHEENYYASGTITLFEHGTSKTTYVDLYLGRIRSNSFLSRINITDRVITY